MRSRKEFYAEQQKLTLKKKQTLVDLIILYSERSCAFTLSEIKRHANFFLDKCLDARVDKIRVVLFRGL